LSLPVCRFGHKLHASNSRLVRHSKTGKTWRRCLICHAARQRELRAFAQNRLLTFEQRADVSSRVTRLRGMSAGCQE
jgi:hypothetical protein